jgi:aminoglycoside/choline kinase family phosphotransferase
MDQDELEQARRQLYLRAARSLGFPERQAQFLAFWRWLARQRGETKARGASEYAAVSRGWFARRTG